MRFQQFGYVFAPPPLPGRLSLDMQQQHQSSSLTHATWSAGVGNVTNDAVNSGAVPFTIPANSSQRLTDLATGSTSGVVPGRTSATWCHGTFTRFTTDLHLFNLFPPADSENISQASANSFFASASFFFFGAAAPSLVNTASLTSHHTTCKACWYQDLTSEFCCAAVRYSFSLEV